MNTPTHPVTPEDLMAFLDTETFGKEALRIEKHMRQCPECTALAAEFRDTKYELIEWTVPPIPQQLSDSILAAADAELPRKSAASRRATPLSFGNWRLWAIGGSGAAVALLALVAVGITLEHRRQTAYLTARTQSESEATSRSQVAGGLARMDALKAAPAAPPAVNAPAPASADTNTSSFADSAPTAPMIARTVSLALIVKDYAPARSALDAILARHRGYAAQLTLNTPENDARTFSASLRVPSTELDSTLAELRQLGRVQSESQSGEEVTQQHVDLTARLRNARETEARLLDILNHRTGKVDEVLDVEEKISETRGEIETMEAELKDLDHRVSFASIDLQLTEEFHAQLGTPTPSVLTRMRNAFVAGLGHAGTSLLSLVLFFEEFGPALLIWLAIAAVPVFFLWRRYRRLRASF